MLFASRVSPFLCFFPVAREFLLREKRLPQEKRNELLDRKHLEETLAFNVPYFFVDSSAG